MPRYFEKSLLVSALLLATAGVVAVATPAAAASYSGSKVCGLNYTPYLKATTSGSATFYAPGDSSPVFYADGTATTHTVYGNPGGGAWRVTTTTLTGVSTGCAPFSR